MRFDYFKDFLWFLLLQLIFCGGLVTFNLILNQVSVNLFEVFYIRPEPVLARAKAAALN